MRGSCWPTAWFRDGKTATQADSSFHRWELESRAANVILIWEVLLMPQAPLNLIIKNNCIWETGLAANSCEDSFTGTESRDSGNKSYRCWLWEDTQSLGNHCYQWRCQSSAGIYPCWTVWCAWVICCFLPPEDNLWDVIFRQGKGARESRLVPASPYWRLPPPRVTEK